MKALRTVLAVFLVIIIAGGVGYLGYTYLFMNHGGMNMAPSQTMSPGAMQEMQGTQNGQQQNTAVPNVIAAQNRERLSEASALVDQAMDLISIDPYSKATVPNRNGNAGVTQVQPGQGGGTINVYPGGNSSVTIMPGTNNPVVNAAPAATANPGAANNAPANNFVYDQNQLRQLHSDIYNVAQGIMMIKALNDDLLVQSSTAETNPPDYQTYVIRYNTALQNKTKLNNATARLNSISTMVNVNPYAPQSGYEFKSGSMDNLHEGVYKLAQAMVVLNRLNDDFTRQMTDASVGAQNAANSINLMPNMNMNNTNPISLNTIFNIVIIVLLVGLVAGIIGAVVRMARRNNNADPADGAKNA